MKNTRRNLSTRIKKPNRAVFFPPEIPHRLAQDWAPTSAVIDRPAPAWTMTVLWVVPNFTAFLPSIFSTQVHLTERVSTAQTHLTHVTEEYETLYWTQESGFDLTRAQIKETLPTPSRSNSFSKFTINNYKLVLPVVNPLKTKRRLLYLKTQFVQRSKHFSSRL